jgi:hypothetical protein
MAHQYYNNGGGRTMYSSTDECYDDAGKHGSRRMMYSSHTDECYDDVDRGRPGAYADDCYNGAGGGRQTAVYSDEYSSRGGGYGCGGGGQLERSGFRREELFRSRRQEKEHKHKERLGEVGALAGGAFALVCMQLYIYICNIG